MTINFGTLLPISAEFYGEICPEELAQFVCLASEALQQAGFRCAKTLSPNTDSEQELWIMGQVILNREGKEDIWEILDSNGRTADLNIPWLELVGSDSEVISNYILGSLLIFELEHKNLARGKKNGTDN